MTIPGVTPATEGPHSMPAKSAQPAPPRFRLDAVAAHAVRGWWPLGRGRCVVSPADGWGEPVRQRRRRGGGAARRCARLGGGRVPRGVVRVRGVAGGEPESDAARGALPRLGLAHGLRRRRRGLVRCGVAASYRRGPRRLGRGVPGVRVGGCVLDPVVARAALAVAALLGAAPRGGLVGDSLRSHGGGRPPWALEGGCVGERSRGRRQRTLVGGLETAAKAAKSAIPARKAVEKASPSQPTPAGPLPTAEEIEHEEIPIHVHTEHVPTPVPLLRAAAPDDRRRTSITNSPRCAAQRSRAVPR